ncbi:MAG: hypothetical protein JAZ11_02745 [Candidatus Thiodiazotropha lotti]|nr:hypothetical protein [Candidatus Thiodiazotropha lotti]
MKMIRIIGITVAVAGLTLSGCTAIPVNSFKQAAEQGGWRFDAYRITEGQGQMFADAQNSYAILPDGAKAKQVQVPGDIQAPQWTQEGAVIRIEGCLEKVTVIPEEGVRLVAKATTSCPSSPPASPAPIPEGKAADKTPSVQTTPLTKELAFKGSHIEPLTKEGKTQ